MTNATFAGATACTSTPTGSSSPWSFSAIFWDGIPLGMQVGNALLVGALILGLTLPQALLLWIEPDMEFEEPAAAEYPPA
jgi:hypothetical protein